MPPRKIPTQSDIFYDSYWTEYVDLCFVMKLKEEATRIGQPLTINAIGSIRRARQEVNLEFCSMFSREYCDKRFQKLEERYCTFRDLIEMPETTFEPESNTIHANQRVWDRICMSKELGVAYMRQGEPCWDYLKTIFGYAPQIKIPPTREVINISSEDRDSRIPIPISSNRPNTLTRNSGTVNKLPGGFSGASSTGRSGFSVTNRKSSSTNWLLGDDDPSSQASCSWADVSREI